jgi:hypothetical protein
VRWAQVNGALKRGQHFYRVTYTAKNAVAAAVTARRSTAGSR